MKYAKKAVKVPKPNQMSKKSYIPPAVTEQHLHAELKQLRERIAAVEVGLQRDKERRRQLEEVLGLSRVQ